MDFGVHLDGLSLRRKAQDYFVRQATGKNFDCAAVPELGSAESGVLGALGIPNVRWQQSECRIGGGWVMG